MRKYDFVLFDLDGTLLNTIDDLADAGNWVCRQNGWPEFTVEQFKHMVGNGIPRLVKRFSPEDQRTPERLKATLAQFTARYDAHKEDKTCPYPGMEATLRRLLDAGVPCGVVSNKQNDLARAIVEHHFPGVFARVRGAVAGCPVKPAPDGVQALMAAMGADPARTLYVGDSNVDIYTAHNAKLPGCGAVWVASKEDVLKQESVRLTDGWKAQFDREHPNGTPGQDNLWLISLLDFYKEHSEFYLAVYHAGLSDIMLDTLLSYFDRSPEIPNALAYLNSAIGYMLYGWVHEWMCRGMQESGTELARMFEQTQKKQV